MSRLYDRPVLCSVDPTAGAATAASRASDRGTGELCEHSGSARLSDRPARRDNGDEELEPLLLAYVRCDLQRVPMTQAKRLELEVLANGGALALLLGPDDEVVRVAGAEVDVVLFDLERQGRPDLLSRTSRGSRPRSSRTSSS